MQHANSNLSLNNLSVIGASSSILSTAVRLWVHLQTSYQRFLVENQKIVCTLQEIQENELCQLLDIPATNVVVDAKITGEIVAQHAVQLEEVENSCQEAQKRFVEESRTVFSSFLATAAQDLLSLEADREGASLKSIAMMYRTTNVSCKTLIMPNSLPGSAMTTRHNDPATSPIHVNVSPLCEFDRCILLLPTESGEIEENELCRLEEHLRRLAAGRLSCTVFFGSSKNAAKLHAKTTESCLELLLPNPISVLVGEVTFYLSSSIWGCNIVMDYSTRNFDEAWKQILSHVHGLNIDMLSVVVDESVDFSQLVTAWTSRSAEWQLEFFGMSLASDLNSSRFLHSSPVVQSTLWKGGYPIHFFVPTHTYDALPESVGKHVELAF